MTYRGQRIVGRAATDWPPVLVELLPNGAGFLAPDGRPPMPGTIAAPHILRSRHALVASIVATLLSSPAAWASDDGGPEPVLTGQRAYGDWHDDAPGRRRQLGPQDMPRPFASPSASNTPSVVDPPGNLVPKVPAGYSVTRFATLDYPRLVRVAPNGDIFIAETSVGTIRVLRAPDGALHPDHDEVFASGLEGPFGIAFYPLGADPRWVYVATVNTVVRFPYRSGDLKPSGAPQTIVAKLAASTGYHTTRDIRFSPDGRRMFVSVGSGSNAAGEMERKAPQEIRQWEAQTGPGAAWGHEAGRADVLAFDPEGGHRQVFATGLRNCVGLAIHPVTGDLWCSTNERDGMGDNLVPDYVTRVRAGGFYGWPWYYVGSNQDPRHAGERPDLLGRVAVPDVLIQPHSAPLAMTFYGAPPGAVAAFPAEYDGDAFVALHGSWNRARRTGYKVIRVPLHAGVPAGVYEDFMTGLVVDDDDVWARPVGVAVAHDGALLVTEDGNGLMWRIAYHQR